MLSIIIPTLNEERYLPLLLESIKKQTLPNFVSQNLGGQDFKYEIIVADAGSADKTVEIAKRFDCKVICGGLPAKGRNEGAKIAEGDIFFFMDADNIFLPEKFFEKLLEEFKKRNLGVASFPIYPNGKKIDKFFYGFYNNLVNLTQIPYATNVILVKREIFEKVGGFDEEIRIGEDHYFAKMAAKFAKFGFINLEPALTSSRRLERDGRFKTYLKYILAGIYMFFFGPIKSDIFKYQFNHYLKKTKKEV